MVLKHYLGVTDYFVIGISLLISAGIGITARKYGTKQTTAKGYLLAGKKMSKIPVILSIVATAVTPSSILGMPPEIYRYGAVAMSGVLSMPIGMFLATNVFLPVYFQCGVSTVNEFLEMRFGRIIRLILSGVFLAQMVFLMSTALYGSVLALSAVTNLPLEICIVTLGVICTFYSSLGGLKAVLWTDAFQAVLIFVCVISVFIASIGDAGGFLKIYQISKHGKRLDLFDFDTDLTKRYTTWTSNIRGFLFGLGYYGTNQIEVQRTLSMSSTKRAKSTLRLSILPAILTFSACTLLGIVMYSIFYLCDPVLNKKETGLTKYDQLVPWYIVNKFSYLPGMTGLCIAGIFCASLSTISSALNSASTVTVIDFIKPLYKNENTISDTKIVWLAKLCSIIYGGICVGLTFTYLDIRSIIQLSSLMLSATEGPRLAIFLVGVLTRKANDKCVSLAFVVSYVAMGVISFGALYSKYLTEPLPLSTSMCHGQNATFQSNISTAMCGNGKSCSLPYTTTLPPKLSPTPAAESFILFRISYSWHPLMGFIITLILISLSILVPGWKENVIPENSKCLSPVTRLWMKSFDSNETVKDNATNENDHELPFLNLTPS